MSPSEVIDSNHNALLPEFEARLSPEYVALYNKNIRGRKLAHEYDIEEVRKNPIIIGFGYEDSVSVKRAPKLRYRKGRTGS